MHSNHPVNGKFQTTDIPESGASYDTSGGECEVSKSDMERGYSNADEPDQNQNDLHESPLMGRMGIGTF